MLSFLSKVIKINNVTVLSYLKTDEGEDCHTITLRKKGNSLSVVSSHSYKDLDDFLDNYNSKLPVLLLLEGKGVLNKKIDPKNTTDLTWKKNIDFNTVYFTELVTSQYTFLSFTRRHNVDEIISLLQKKGIHILDFYLGPLTTALLQNAIDENLITSNNSLLEFEGGTLINLTKDEGKEKNYAIGDTRFSSVQLSSYGAGIHFFIKQKEISKSYSELIDNEEFIYKKSFNYLAIGMLGLFFTLLLISYFGIQYYSGQNNALNQENVYSNQTYQYIKNLEEQKESKLKILNDSGQLSEKFLTYYVYTLSSSIPQDLSVSQIEVFPVIGEVKQNKKIELQSNQIMLKGATFNESSFNDWLRQLKKVDWIKEFEVLSFKKDKKNMQHFEIKILVSDV
ncbi:PilN domain-containing protein [Flavobacterium sp. C4GT6]|uniref:PilN domain-containing protein n=1 Tax=Flavobacterium sp. C4GT6 TaxID=3103818 RepID=UPI002ED64616